LARQITADIDIPTIGIGASPACDGQILVSHDMLGLFTSFRPKFVKRYAELGEQAEAAIAAYATDMRNRHFPAVEHLYVNALKAGDFT
ncbi:3-methyl-2-oxobutanoate hydroxymethyltransferase, partial [Mesorhizobium sp. M7A.F.Ca.CA.002.09.1.1]